MAHMRIFDRRTGTMISSGEWQSEGALDEFLFLHPEALSSVLYPDEDRMLLIPLGRQLWKTDILFLRLDTLADPHAALLVCEDKKAGNPELRRTVLGQTIDYVSLIADMDEETFVRVLEEHAAAPERLAVLERLVASGLVDAETVDASIEAARLAQRARRVEAVICAEAIPERLLSMTKWLNEVGAASTAARALLCSCEVRPLSTEHGHLVALAATVAEARGIGLATLDEDQRRALRVTAELLLADPVFQVALVEVRPHGDVVSLDARASTNGPHSAQAGGIETLADWLAHVPSPDVRALYEAVSRALGPQAIWRTGGATGAQLVLQLVVPMLSKPLHVLRLRSADVTFVPFGQLERQGLHDLSSWARDAVASLGVEEPHARQPVLSAQAIAGLSECGFSPVVTFAQELRDRVDAALTTVG